MLTSSSCFTFHKLGSVLAYWNRITSCFETLFCVKAIQLTAKSINERWSIFFPFDTNPKVKPYYWYVLWNDTFQNIKPSINLKFPSALQINPYIYAEWVIFSENILNRKQYSSLTYQYITPVNPCAFYIV